MFKLKYISLLASNLIETHIYIFGKKKTLLFGLNEP